MNLRTLTLGSALLLIAAVVCAAQEPATPQQPPQEQKPRHPTGDHPRPDRSENLMQILSNELKLDEAQQAQVKALLDEFRNREKELRTSTPIPAELQEKTAKVRDEMRQAREAGDSARVDQLREELKALQKEREEFLKPVREKLDESQAMLHDQILSTLREEQKAAFTELWDERLAGPDAYGGPVRNPRALKSQVDKLTDLTADQKKQIAAVFEEYRRATRASASSGLKARTELTKKLYDDVFALLSAEQRAKIEKSMEGERGPKGGRQRPPKADEGAKGQKPAEGGQPQPPPPPPTPPPAQ